MFSFKRKTRTKYLLVVNPNTIIKNSVRFNRKDVAIISDFNVDQPYVVSFSKSEVDYDKLKELLTETGIGSKE